MFIIKLTKLFDVQTDLCSLYYLFRIRLALQRDEALLPLFQPRSALVSQDFIDHHLSVQSTPLLRLIQRLFSILQDPQPLLLSILRCLLQLLFLLFFEVQGA